MKLKEYLKDQLSFIITFILNIMIILLMLTTFKVEKNLIIAIIFILLISNLYYLFFNYFRKKGFYQELLNNIELLDKSYLVLETLQKPSFYEGKLLHQALYDINKSMNEYVKNLEIQVNDFKEYIEMWIHEVKVPLASLTLMLHNNKKEEKNLNEQLRRIEDYLEQVLYYVRSENAEKDYLIKETKLEKIMNSIALKNKDDLLENKIDLIVENIDYQVLTDSKWLEFMMNQIINNSIKYRKKETNSYIKISAIEKEKKVVLTIEDNGIGIPQSDINRVFEKSFTGQNGRKKSKSTGMGLFIANNLCHKLGHKIMIESVENHYTKVSIIFVKNKYYDVTK